MNELSMLSAPSPFDAIRHTDHRGEWWSARELMAHFGYSRWSDVCDGVARAQAAIDLAIGETAGRINIEPDLKNVRVGFGDRQIDDFRLTRYGAYMWAMNGDARKPEIANALTYFAVRTRQAELHAADGDDDMDILQGMVDRLRETRRRVQLVEGRQDVTEAKVAAIEGRHDWFTALGYAKYRGDLSTARPYLARVGQRAAAIMRGRGEEPERRQDSSFGTVNVYPADVLAEAFEAVGDR